MKNLRKVTALLLMAVMVAGMLALSGSDVQAAKKKVQLNKKTVTLEVGKKVTLKLKNAPKKKKITWSSNKKKIATVSKKGVVTAKKAGKANIIAKVNGKKYICKVTVKTKKKEDNKKQETQKPEKPTNSNNSSDLTTPSNPTTPSKPNQPAIPEPPKEVTLINTEGKNPNDVAALKKIITAQNSNGANIPLDLNAHDTVGNFDIYQWDENGRLYGLDWADRGMSGSLDLSGLTELTDVQCANNELSNLNVSGATKLKELACGLNELSSLDVSKNKALEKLWCGYNNISNLDVSGATELKELRCYHNSLTSLDVSKNKKLEYLDCDYNSGIVSLDVTANTALKELYYSSTVQVIGWSNNIE